MLTFEQAIISGEWGYNVLDDTSLKATLIRRLVGDHTMWAFRPHLTLDDLFTAEQLRQIASKLDELNARDA